MRQIGQATGVGRATRPVAGGQDVQNEKARYGTRALGPYLSARHAEGRPMSVRPARVRCKICGYRTTGDRISCSGYSDVQIWRHALLSQTRAIHRMILTEGFRHGSNGWTR